MAKIESGVTRQQISREKQEARVQEQIKQDRMVLGTSNIRVEPGHGAIGDGKVHRVNTASGHGHLLALHRQQPNTWTKPMVDAGMRFSRDYDLTNYRGMQAMGLSPKVDSSGSGGDITAVSIVAKSRLQQLALRIGEDHYAMLVLVCGVGLTFTDMHAQKMGDKRHLSEILRVALRKADAFYQGRKEEPMSDFMTRAHRVITAIKEER